MWYFFFCWKSWADSTGSRNAGADTEGKKIDCGSEIQSIF